MTLRLLIIKDFLHEFLDFSYIHAMNVENRLKLASAARSAG